MNIEELRRLFSYNPKSGELTWKVSPCNSVKVGQRTGKDNGNGYLKMQYKGNKMYAHRVAYAIYHGVVPKTIDHVNGDSLDNRICNLRSCTQKQNTRNQKVRNTNTTGVNGVSFDKKRGVFESKICVDGKTIHLGRFKTLGEASGARAKADLTYKFHHNHGAR